MVDQEVVGHTAVVIIGILKGLMSGFYGGGSDDFEPTRAHFVS